MRRDAEGVKHEGLKHDGLKSDVLRAALVSALAGSTQKLEEHLCRHGGGPDARPNLRLAAAFGVELAALPASPVRLLAKFSADDAAPDDPRVFLPIAAGHGWVALLREDRHSIEAWAALAELSADERVPVRLATRDALSSFALHASGAAALVANALEWLEIDDLDRRFLAAALVVEILSERRVVTSLAQAPVLLEYLSRAINEIVEAPRSAERMDGRRRLLLSLPPTLATVVATLAQADKGPSWFHDMCTTAQHPDIRKTLSDTLLRLHKTSLGTGSAVSERLRRALERSAKPLRDPSRLRPGTGRGKSSRQVR